MFKLFGEIRINSKKLQSVVEVEHGSCHRTNNGAAR